MPQNETHELDEADQAIIECLNPQAPKSFFLYAGAGSGKTKALVESLDAFRRASGRRLRLRGQQVSVITYTNAACDEIRRRVDFDPVVKVLTIHSFVWELVKGFNHDIKEWLSDALTSEVLELQGLLAKGRAGTKAARERERGIEVCSERLAGLPQVKTFTYSPSGENRSRESLNHSEVIQVGASFLSKKPVMRRLLVSGSPVLLIDESQDTNRHLMDAFLSVQAEHRERFTLGLFGDTMQRIYSDGKVDLGQSLPDDWVTPAKKTNHRCPKRIVRLVNQIRSPADNHMQEPCKDAKDGYARLYISTREGVDKARVEVAVRKAMAEVTADTRWAETTSVKMLILEHHMAARRMGFLTMFEPLAALSESSTSLLDAPVVKFFTELVYPVAMAHRLGDRFASTSIVREHSPLLDRESLVGAKVQGHQVTRARDAVIAVSAFCDPEAKSTFHDVLRCVAESQLFQIPDVLYPFAFESISHSDGTGEVEEDEDTSPTTSQRDGSIRNFLAAPFSELTAFMSYFKDQALFGTHQGVKGLEFPRVMVIVDDGEAKGFLFSYEKLFGIKGRTKADLENERLGKETSVDRTRRLFYVTCSRSEESLAIVAYTDDPERLREQAVLSKWFETEEIEVVTLPS